MARRADGSITLAVSSGELRAVMKERVEAQLLSLQLYIFRAATKPEWQDRQVAQKYLLPTQEQRSDEAAKRARGSITFSTQAGP